MINGFNIAQYKVLLVLAERLVILKMGFEINRFKEDMTNGNGMNEFRKDVQEVKFRSMLKIEFTHAIQIKQFIQSIVDISKNGR